MKLFYATIIFLFLVIGIFLYYRLPIVTGKISKQTIYLSLVNFFHQRNSSDTAHYMFIDDDSGPGIFRIRKQYLQSLHIIIFVRHERVIDL